jgi:hypothetical protein
MMEGVSGEAASLAGHLHLSNLCWIYDNNRLTIEGQTSLAFSEDVATRFIGYGWNVTRVGDANDLEMLARAFLTFLNTKDGPTLIIMDSHIGYGSPNKQDTSGAHGEPLGEEEIRLAKRHYGWPEDKKFYVPEDVYDHFRHGVGTRGKNLARRMVHAIRSLSQAMPRPRRRTVPHATPPASGTLGPRPSRVSRRPERFGDSRVLGQGSGRGRQEHSLVDGRVRRPRPSPRPASRKRAPAISRRRITRDEICTSGSASTPWARYSTDSVW